MRKLLVTLLICASATLAAGVPASLDPFCADMDKALAALPSASGRTLAVLPFTTRIAGEQDYGTTVAEYLVSCLGANPANQIVDRARFAEVMQEQDLAASDLVDSAHAIQTGKLLSARWLLTGSIADVLGKRLLIGNVIDAETGAVLTSVRATLPAEDLTALRSALLGESGQKSAAVFRSALIPGWGQFYTDHSVRGSLWLGGAAVMVGATVWGFTSANNMYDDYTNMNYLKTQDTSNAQVARILAVCGDACRNGDGSAAYDLLDSVIGVKADKNYQQYLDRHQIAVGLAIGTGILWLANIWDAYRMGSAQVQKVNLYFAPQVAPGNSGAAVGVQMKL